MCCFTFFHSGARSQAAARQLSLRTPMSSALLVARTRPLSTVRSWPSRVQMLCAFRSRL